MIYGTRNQQTVVMVIVMGDYHNNHNHNDKIDCCDLDLAVHTATVYPVVPKGSHFDWNNSSWEGSEFDWTYRY